DLLPLSFIALSTGQMRRARIARTLLAQPELLILDDPFLGLDVAGRCEVADLLGGLVGHGARLILITRADAIPDWVTHVLELDQQAASWQGPRTDRPSVAGGDRSSTHHSALSTRHSSGEPIVE